MFMLVSVPLAAAQPQRRRAMPFLQRKTKKSLAQKAPLDK
jgi:hypothetical protein